MDLEPQLAWIEKEYEELAKKFEELEKLMIDHENDDDQ